ncbi:MAG: LamG domain-containing protein [bacterium]
MINKLLNSLAMLFVTIAALIIFTGCQTAQDTTADATTTTTSTTTTTTILVPDGLVAYYTFDESTGSTASDSSGSGLDGTVYGATWATGHLGNALSFDGTDDAVKIPASGEAAPSAIAALETGSISLWFKFEGAPGTEGFFLPIFYLGPSAEVSGSKEGAIIEIGHRGVDVENLRTSTKLFYTITLAGSEEPIFCYDSSINLTAEAWYHFVVTVSSEGNTGYLNGEEMTYRHYNFPTRDFDNDSLESYFLSPVTSDLLSIGFGRSAVDSFTYYYDGLIDEVRIYNRPLTAAEVTQLYQEE